MKYHNMLLIVGLVLAGCGQPGDRQESKIDKTEWSILHGLEVSHRGQPIRGIEYSEKDGYQIISLMGMDQKTRLWIMADPKSAPFYKQLPTAQNYTLTKQQLEDVCDRCSATVSQVLESHQEDKGNAEPIVGGDGKPAPQR